jgi:DNA repair protein RadC
MQTLTRSLRLATAAATRRIVLANVVSEHSLPYNLHDMDNPEKCHEIWQSVVATQPDHEPDKETLVVFMLSARLRPFAWNRVSLGSCSETSAHPREILRPVIASNAFAFVMMHNHPSGDPSPSRGDEMITKRMVEAAALMHITFLDHLVIGMPAPGRMPYYSFREAGLIG